MAQTIKLRRSSTEGKVPTTSQLALGEIAINTHDGRVFFEKNDGSATIQHIVTTNSITTGSIQLSDNDGTSAGSKVVLGSGTGSLQIVGDSANDNFFIFNKAALAGGQSQTLFVNAPTINIGGADPDTTTRATNVEISPTNLKFTNLSNQASERTALMINGSNVVGTRELGTAAFSAATDFLTGHPNISAASSVDNSNGSVIQDVTLDSNGHVTALGSANLDGRYYTETESDTLFTKKLGQGVVSGSAQIADVTLTNAAQTNITSLGTLTSLTVDDITINGSTISDGGDLTLDANGDIILDANGADIKLEDNGTAFGRLKRTSSDFVIKSDSNNNDIIFKGVDNSSTITALTLDMSDAGTAIFENNIKLSGSITFEGFDPTIQLSNTTEALFVSGSGLVGVRSLGTNAFTSTTITPDGGNADKVDNLHASSFLRSDADDTAANKITFDGGIAVPDSTTISVGTGGDFTISDDGTDTLIKSTRHGGEVYFQNENASGTNQNTLILGTDTANTDRTYVELRYNNVERIRTTSDGSRLAGVVNFDGTTNSTAKTNGTVIIDGGVGIAKTLNVGEDVVAFASSDERYKDLITPIQNPNEKIKLLSGNTFVWNDKHEVFKGKKDIGVIAQEVEKVLPEIVETRDNGYKAVKYEKIVALLIESNKELIKRVEELESKIK